MIYNILKLNEATDISHFDKTTAALIRIPGHTIPKVEQLKDKDDLVIAVHGTNSFWALWFCLYGVDASIEPPTKTLGRGNMQTGFSKIKSSGLFVAAEKTSGFRTHVYFEVKPSELGISLEMAEGGFEKGDELYSLIVGDCIIDTPLPAKRVLKIIENKKEFSRKSYMENFPNPYKYIQANIDRNTYSGTPLVMKYMKNDFYKEIKDELNSGSMTIDAAIEIVQDGIKYKDYTMWGFADETEIQQLLGWLYKRKES